MTRQSSKKELLCRCGGAIERDMTYFVSSVDAEAVIDQIYDDFESRTCENCKYRDTERPISHVNWRECNNRDNIMSYQETLYSWGCNDFERKEQ